MQCASVSTFSIILDISWNALSGNFTIIPIIFTQFYFCCDVSLYEVTWDVTGRGGIIANESCRGSGGILGQKIFRFGGSEMLFSALCHEIYRRKIDLEYENGKQLQVTIIKITESKENKSIQRLGVSGPTGPRGGTAAPLTRPLARALEIVAWSPIHISLHEVYQ